MGFYQFKREQVVAAPIHELWEFVSDPVNLKKITPDYMGFDILTPDLPKRMYEGMIIAYRVSPLPFFGTTWVTEITHCKEGTYFVDEQRMGPYKLWHHQHILEALDENSSLMKDIVSYQPPLGFLGAMANQLLIQKKLEEIFDYRCSAFDQFFGKEKSRTQLKV